MADLNQIDKQVDQKYIQVKQCDDFEIDGKGTNKAWESVAWNELQFLDPTELPLQSRFKIMYSATGIYVFFDGEDEKITTNFSKDQGDLYEGDVFEVFFHTDTRYPLYFEYEINQLGKELVLLVPNIDGVYHGWQPWHYEGDRVVQKKVHVSGGEPKPGTIITGWSAELFFPYELLEPLANVPPKHGTSWRANFYRMDYDRGKRIKWSWRPIENNFHEYKKFGELVFE